MIAGVSGNLVQKSADVVLVDVHGVTYRVGTSSTTVSDLGDIGESVRLYTHLVVREDQLALFGFGSIEELTLFETLITVSGIGPRMACTILSRLSVGDLSVAIEAGNADLLATVPGVGKKTAARLIVDLRGKLPSTGSSGSSGATGEPDVIEALQSLGYTIGEATLALSQLPPRSSESVEDRILRALQQLGEG